MIIQLHTPEGIYPLDTKTVTDIELAQLGLTREQLNELSGEPDYSRACELLTSSPSVITQPEMWELMRIFGRHMGYKD